MIKLHRITASVFLSLSLSHAFPDDNDENLDPEVLQSVFGVNCLFWPGRNLGRSPASFSANFDGEFFFRKSSSLFFAWFQTAPPPKKKKNSRPKFTPNLSAHLSNLIF